MQKLFTKLSPNKSKLRQTSIQFYCNQAESRRKKPRFSFNKHPLLLHNETPLISQRNSRIQKYYFEQNSNRLACVSCECLECGRDSKFKQKNFRLYPFQQTRFQRRRLLYRRFRKFVHCIQFIIRYRIVQHIRERQRLKMKKAFKPHDMLKPNAIQNLLSAAAKQLKKEKEQEEMQEHDSDEEYYHLKPKSNVSIKKSCSPQLVSPKQNRKLHLLYFLKETQRPMNRYVSNRVSVSPQVSVLPPLQSLVTTHRKNHSCYLKKAIKI